VGKNCLVAASALTLDRVRNDIEVLARSGLMTEEFVIEVAASLTRAVPNSGLCLSLIDPATLLLTSTFKFGEMAGHAEGDIQWALYEYGTEHPEPSAITEMVRNRVPAMAVSIRDDPAQSPRLRDFIRPHLGYTDELRVLASDADETWGGMSLFRCESDPVFTEAEVAYASTLAASLASGLRSSLVVAHVAAVELGERFGPAVIVVGPDDRPRLISPGAADMVAEFAGATASAHLVIPSLLGHARRYAMGLSDRLPRTRVRDREGRWLVLHAAPLSGPDGHDGDVAITIEEARPPDVLPLIVAGFNLTARERDVVELVIQGVDTKEIARTLRMSAYTVQDHLKSIFTKVDVRSRRELMTRIFLGHYAPRLGSHIAPTGWFVAAPETPPELRR
jgi:DNA-binding CsgD family transcriptional regulator